MPYNSRGFSWLTPRMNLNSPVLSTALPVQVDVVYSDEVQTGGPKTARIMKYDTAYVRLKTGVPRKPQKFYVLIRLVRIHDLALVDTLS
jgi:hypothetical protein